MSVHQTSYSVLFMTSLLNLNRCSKSLINKLTFLAQENSPCASGIVRLLEDYIYKIPGHLHIPVFYLIDSIVKNVKEPYVTLFSQNIVNIYVSTVNRSSHDKKKLEALYQLRNTWTNVFPSTVLDEMDAKIRTLHERRTIQQQIDRKLVKKKKKELQDLQKHIAAINAANRIAQRREMNKKRQRAETSMDIDSSREKRRKLNN